MSKKKGRDLSKIPPDAQVTSDLDCVMLTSWPSYFSGIVRLAAVEKGIKWKHYFINHYKEWTHLEPWYVKLNPNAYVPTMIVKGTEGPNTEEGNPPQVGITESSVILNYIDDNFEGTKDLMKNKDPEVKERY